MSDTKSNKVDMSSIGFGIASSVFGIVGLIGSAGIFIKKSIKKNKKDIQNQYVEYIGGASSDDALGGASTDDALGGDNKK